MSTQNWLTLIGIVSSGVIGYFIKYFLDKKAQFGSQNAEIKRIMYQEYVDFILGLMNKLQSQTVDVDTAQSTEIVEKMREFHKRAVLYSSPNVINAYSDMMQFFYRNGGVDKDPALSMVMMTNVFKMMRNEIGLSNRGLGSGAIKLMRPLINDYDISIKPKEVGLLLKAKTPASGNSKEREPSIKNDM